MQTRVLGGTGLRVGVVGFGAWQLANPLWGGPDRTESVRLVQAALAAGCNFFDTAPGYGEGASETVLGEALQGRRDHAVICTKFGHGGPAGEDFSAGALRPALEESLRRLRTDRVDVLLLHNPPGPLLDATRSADLYAELEALRTEGKLRSYGASIDRLGELDSVTRSTPSRVAEVLYNVLHQEVAGGFAPAAARGIGLIAKVPLDSGWLSGKYGAGSRFTGIRARWSEADIRRRAEAVAHVQALVPAGLTLPAFALGFILAHPEVATVIPGVRNQAQLEANLAAAEVRLSAGTVAAAETLWRDHYAASPLPW